MLEVLGALVQVVDLTLKKVDYGKKVRKDQIAYDLVALLIELDRVEQRAAIIRHCLSCLEENKDQVDQVKVNIKELRDAIRNQISVIYDINYRIHSFTPLLSVYMEEYDLPYELKGALCAKHMYLDDTLGQLFGDEVDEKRNFEFTINSTSEVAMQKLAEFKRQLASLIKEHVSIEDFVKWYSKKKVKHEC